METLVLLVLMVLGAILAFPIYVLARLSDLGRTVATLRREQLRLGQLHDVVGELRRDVARLKPAEERGEPEAPPRPAVSRPPQVTPAPRPEKPATARPPTPPSVTVPPEVMAPPAQVTPYPAATPPLTGRSS